MRELDRRFGGLSGAREPSDICPVDVGESIAKGRPSGSRCWFRQQLVAKWANHTLVLSPAVVGKGEKLLDGLPIHEQYLTMSGCASAGSLYCECETVIRGKTDNLLIEDLEM